MPRNPEAQWFVAGARLDTRLAQQIGPRIAIPAAGTTAESSASVDGWLERLRDGDAGEAGPRVLRVLHNDERGLAERRLLPLPELPPRRIPRGTRNLPARALLPGLLEEALRACLLGAQLRSLMQENRDRLAQMQRAEDHLQEAELHWRRRYFRQRQADITGELENLMTSLQATLELTRAHPSAVRLLVPAVAAQATR
jgi:F-type H+-transporting ATPase subunit gamma